MKSYFMARNMREKLLILLMLVVALIIWGSFFIDRAGNLMGERNRLNRFNQEMSVYLDNQEFIRERVQEGTKNLDPSRTLNATRLSVEAGEMARRHGLNPSITSPRTEPGDVFSNHAIILRVNDASLAALVHFTGELHARAPYMGLDEVSVNAKADPRLLDATFRISSIELNR